MAASLLESKLKPQLPRFGPGTDSLGSFIRSTRAKHPVASIPMQHQFGPLKTPKVKIKGVGIPKIHTSVVNPQTHIAKLRSS